MVSSDVVIVLKAVNQQSPANTLLLWQNISADTKQEASIMWTMEGDKTVNEYANQIGNYFRLTCFPSTHWFTVILVVAMNVIMGRTLHLGKIICTISRWKHQYECDKAYTIRFYIDLCHGLSYVEHCTLKLFPPTLLVIHPDTIAICAPTIKILFVPTLIFCIYILILWPYLSSFKIIINAVNKFACLHT